ncbi:MAG: nickel insertion protein [Cyanobacteria bacterium J06635_13]
MADTCKTIIFRETTTLGIRERTQHRSILDREIKTIRTKYGSIRVKVASWEAGENKRILNAQPEYEDCAALARQHDLPWREISQQALQDFNQILQSN